jgi:hypothetical protein
MDNAQLRCNKNALEQQGPIFGELSL